jgi:DNA-binding CsgD family transcriptional regulator
MHPGLSASALSQTLDLLRQDVQSSLDRLLVLRLIRPVTGRPGSFMPTRSEAAIGALVHRKLADMDDLLLTLEELQAQYSVTGDSVRTFSPIEVLSGTSVAGRSPGHQVFQQLLQSVRHEMLALDQATQSWATGSAEVAAEAPVLARGVSVRSVYQASSLFGVGRLPYVRQLVALGEQAHMYPELPTQLVIFDRRVAWLPLDADSSPTHTSVLVHPSPLLDALIALFEAYWQGVTELPPTADTDPYKGLVGVDAEQPGMTAQERELLMLLAAGLPDNAIAAELNISLSTLRRRLSALMSRLGAKTRFQAATVAHRRGWIGS